MLDKLYQGVGRSIGFIASNVYPFKPTVAIVKLKEAVWGSYDMCLRRHGLPSRGHASRPLANAMVTM